MENCTRCGRPAQRALCTLCQHETEMARRQAPRGVIVPKQEREARKQEADHG